MAQRAVSAFMEGFGDLYFPLQSMYGSVGKIT